MGLGKGKNFIGKKLFFSWILFIFIFQNLQAQDSLRFFEDAKSYNWNRTKFAGLSAAGLYIGTFVFLNYAWYKDFERTKFHSFDDNNGWLQIDKFGHFYSAYHICSYMTGLSMWTGEKKKTAIMEGVGLSLLFMSTIEVFDGFSKEWGFSYGDMAANISGIGLFLAQDYFWKEQRISVKFSFFPSKYEKYKPDVLGRNLAENLFKDYNAQTYWLSLNLSAFCPNQAVIPPWLNFAIGYSVDGMLGGYGNPMKDHMGNILPEFEKNRQFFFSPDIELSKIKTKNKFIGLLLRNFRLIKFPLPAVELRGNGKWYFYPLYF